MANTGKVVSVGNIMGDGLEYGETRKGGSVYCDSSRANGFMKKTPKEMDPFQAQSGEAEGETSAERNEW